MSAKNMRLAVFRPRVNAKRWLGGVLIVFGVLYLMFGWPGNYGPPEIEYETLGEGPPDAQWLTTLGARHQADGIANLRISRAGAEPVRIAAVRYRDENGLSHSALFYPGAAGAGENSLRMELWREAADAIGKNAGEDALFVTWWDNAQRVNFLTGRRTWIENPVEAAFTEDSRDFWKKAAGGFEREETRMRQLARWLAMDADQALSEMARELPRDRPVYFLVSLDDLARLSEIEALAGTALPFEIRIFSASDNIHTQITAVRRWAGEKGTGSYLVQQLPQGGVRAWRITSEEGARTLLARLMPFTSSLVKPLEHHKLIYQSRWGAYLSVYQWQP